jgi:NDP-sugar pyrophosphorylase family protein
VLEHICGTADVVIESKPSWVLPGDGLRRPCIIGKNCETDESASIGPNVSIGDNTIISSDVVIENSIIMSGCKIDGGLNIKDSIISANCHLHGNNKDKTKKVFLLGEGTKITL